MPADFPNNPNIGDTFTLNSKVYTWDGVRWDGLLSQFGATFETVSQNLKQYPYTLSYTGEVLNQVIYSLPDSKSITKTLNYTGDKLTSVVLSGDTPSGISLTKTLTYTGDQLTSVNYS
jgi:hypothetical protein